VQQVSKVGISPGAAREQAAFDAIADLYDRTMVRLFSPMTWKVVELAKAQEGDKVLDVATGTGSVALALAPIVRPTGFVIGVDVSQRMLDLARNSADIRGIDNIDFMRRDAASLARLPTNEFTIVTCGLSLQHFDEKEQALKEMLRTLAPGGRLIVSVWGRSERNELETLLLPSLREGHPELRSAYALGDEGVLESLLKGAGFRRIKTERVEGAFKFRSVAAFWDALQAMPGPRKAMEGLAPSDRAALEEKTSAVLAGRATDEGIKVGYEAVYALARKP